MSRPQDQKTLGRRLSPPHVVASQANTSPNPQRDRTPCESSSTILLETVKGHSRTTSSTSSESSGSPLASKSRSALGLNLDATTLQPLRRTALSSYRQTAIQRGYRAAGLGLAEGFNTYRSTTHSTSSRTQVGEEHEYGRLPCVYENGYHVCQVRDCGEMFLNATVMLTHLSVRHGHETAPALSSATNQVDLLSDHYEPYFLPPESEDELDVPVLEVLQATTHWEDDNEHVIENLKCNMCGGRFKNLATIWRHQLRQCLPYDSPSRAEPKEPPSVEEPRSPRHRMVIPASDSDEKVYRCPYCDFSSWTVTELSQHSVQHFTSNGKFACGRPGCTVEFDSSEAMQYFATRHDCPSRRTRKIKGWNHESETHANATIAADEHPSLQPGPHRPFEESGLGFTEDDNDLDDSDSGFSDDSSISHSDCTRNQRSSTSLSTAQQTPACTTTPLTGSASRVSHSPSASVDPSLRQLLDETVHGSNQGLDSTQCASSSDHGAHDPRLVQSLTHRLVNNWISAVLKETEENASKGHSK